MKLKLLILIIFLSNYSYGQILSGKVVGVDIADRENYVELDSIPKVIYQKDKGQQDLPLIFIDGHQQNHTTLHTINPNWIDSIEVKKPKDKNEGIYENGEIHIFMKAENKIELISLLDLKKKYVEDSELPTMYMLDYEFITEEYKLFVVDEKNILKIEVQEINQLDTGIKFQLVHLLTRSKKNIEKENEIRLRGNEE